MYTCAHANLEEVVKTTCCLGYSIVCCEHFLFSRSVSLYIASGVVCRVGVCFSASTLYYLSLGLSQEHCWWSIPITCSRLLIPTSPISPPPFVIIRHWYYRPKNTILHACLDLTGHKSHTHARTCMHVYKCTSSTLSFFPPSPLQEAAHIILTFQWLQPI